MGPLLAIVDYGAGNLRSLSRALGIAGAQVALIRSPAEAHDGDGIVLPGVGAFGPAMARLTAAGFPPWIHERVAAGTPLVGVCLGMQLLFDRSEEASGVSGLGLITGEVRRLPSGLKVPHMGWNRVITRRADPVISDLRESAFAYFVHSYVVDPRDPAGVIATATYGREFPAIIRQGNVLGLQFHPEKSAATGLGLLREIVGWIAATAPSVRAGTHV